MEQKKKATILIVSDAASRDPTFDRTAGELVPVLAMERKWETSIRIVPNIAFQIQQAVCDLTDGPNWQHLILISPTTGFAVKDNTTEALGLLIQQGIPDKIHDTISKSLKDNRLQKTVTSMGGIREKSLIITLPGYPKGATENLEKVMKLLPQAWHSARREIRPYKCQWGRKKPKDHPNSSSSQVISVSISADLDRHYHTHSCPMPSVEEALRIIDEKSPAYIVVDLPVTTSIIGSVLAEDVYPAERVPVSRTSMIDGYAIIARKGRSTKGVFPTASIASIHGALQPLQPGYVARIASGESLPPNANAIVMVEDTAISSQYSPGDTVVEILADDVVPGENVSEPGSDIPLASKILARGDLVSSTGGEVGLLAATGIRTVKVFKKPRVGVLSIGNELIEHSDPRTLVGGQTRDSNRISLLSCLVSWGFETADLGIVHASSCALERSLRDILGGFGFASPGVDMIVTTSDTPLSKLGYESILERLGGSIHFDRVSMKPGISTNFATVPFRSTAVDTATDKTRQQYSSKLIFSLPGDPASALVTLNLFVLYSLQKLAGLGESSQALASKPWIMPQLGLPRVAVVLTHHFYLDPKLTEYHRVVVTGSRSDGRLYATSTGANVIGQISSRVGSLAKANALLVLRPGRGVGIKGEIMEALMMGPIHGSDTRIIC